MDDYKQQLIRKLKFRCKSIGLELKASQSIYNESVPGFCEAVDLFCSDRKCENPLTQALKGKSSPIEGSVEAYIAETLTDKQKEELPAQFRKVFRSIVMETQAKKDNKVGELIALTQDLKIDLSHLSYPAITEIESQVTKMEEDISSLHNSYPWVWYYSNTLHRLKIIERFCVL